MSAKAQQTLAPSLPEPRISQRVPDANRYEEAIEYGYSAPVARVIASRPIPDDTDLLRMLIPPIDQIETPELLQDIVPASERLAKAITEKEVIYALTDHDSDGINSAAVFSRGLALLGVEKDNFAIRVGHRLKEGYGISQGLTDRILAEKDHPELIISADCGSSDEDRIRQFKEHGIDTIVTDHHMMPSSGHPVSAVACLNPQRIDCEFPDKYIAGCMMAWYLVKATHDRMVASGHLEDRSRHLLNLLDYVAVGTIADCVSLSKSVTNRAVFRFGSWLIQQETRPCWKVLRQMSKTPEKPVTSSFCGFQAGPMLNSSGRINDALGGIDFLLARDEPTAWDLGRQLNSENNERKAIERSMQDTAMQLAAEQVSQQRLSITVFLDDGHAGVHGISASRVKDAFGRPTAIFSPKYGSEDVITASLRGIEGTHIRNALQQVADQHPSLFLSFGGHEFAAGCSINHNNLDLFSSEFENAIRSQIDASQVGPMVLTDGRIEPVDLSLALVDEIYDLEPWGKDFEPPLFEMKAKVTQIRPVGTPRVHLQVTLVAGERYLNGIWFFALGDENDTQPVQPGSTYNFVFSVDDNHFRGNRSLQLIIRHAES